MRESFTMRRRNEMALNLRLSNQLLLPKLKERHVTGMGKKCDRSTNFGADHGGKWARLEERLRGSVADS